MTTFSTHLRRALGALAVLALAATAASAQSALFSPLGGARVSLDARQTQYLDALDAERGVEAVELVRAEASRLDAASELRIALPDTEVALQTVWTVLRRTGYRSWAGRSDDGAAWGVLVARDGQITGEVHVGGYVYPVRPLTNGLHAVARKSMADYQMHPDDYEAFLEAERPHIEAERRAADPRAASARTAAAATTVVDIVVPYTLDVAAAFADPVALAQSFVDTANLTYTNSIVDMELDLLYAYETDYTYSGGLGTDLNRLRLASDGHMDEAHAFRDDYGADLVALLSGTHASGTCGVAYVNASASYGFSVSSAGCSAITFVHEVGHNMGSDHDPVTDNDPDPNDGTNDPDYAPYARGYIDTAGSWGTVMGYNARCAGGCEMVPYLSNPDVSYDDDATVGAENDGTTGDATTADNARVHEERMATVAGFRATKAAPSASSSPSALTLTVVPGGSASGAVTIANGAAAGSSPLWWRAALSNVDDDTGTPVADACTGTESVSQPAVSFFDPHAAGGAEAGQSFTAPCTGKLTHVTPSFYGGAGGSWEGTLRVYEGAGTGGTELASVAASGSDPGADIRHTIEIALPTPIEVTSGATYTWFLDLTSGSTRSLYSTANPYSGGARYRTSNGNPASAAARSGEDYTFSLGLAAPDTWAVLASSAGSVSAGASEDVTLTFDATGYAEGTYSGDLVLTLNDPSAASVTVPITMNVTAAAEHVVADGFGWRLLAVPYEGATVQTLADQNYVQGTPDSHPSGSPNLFTSYDGAAWAGAGALTEAVAPGQGVLWYLYDEAFAFDPGDSESVALPMALGGPGLEPSADVVAPLHADGDGWNLLGNPYLLDLNVSGVDGWTGASNLQSFVGQVWQCTPNAASPVECVGSYTTTTLLGDVVPAWSGVFFDAATAGSLTIPISARGTTTRQAAPRLLSFELASADGAALDRAATVVFRDGGTDGWDGWDAEKLASLASPSVQIAFGGERDGEAVLKAQDSRALDPATLEIPVHVSSAGAGRALVLTWPRLDGIPSDWHLSLTDHETNETVDLGAADRYAFEVTETATRSAPRSGASARLGDGSPRFTLAIRTASAVPTEADAPAETWLGAPHPNPTRSTAAVAFGLAEAGAARLTLVDLLGREVAVLAEGERPAGNARVALPASGLAPGVYVVRLEAGDRVLTRRAVVVR